MPYTPPQQAIAQTDVGNLYHVGIGTTDAAGNLTLYGYCFVNDGSVPFHEGIDVTSREQLLTASPELIDRDLVAFPRITQGRFDGGMLQAVAVDLTRYWDSNLDIDLAGYLKLSKQWLIAVSTLNDTPGQAITDGVSAFINPHASEPAATGKIYRWDGAFWVLVDTGLGAVVTRIATDGDAIYSTDGAQKVMQRLQASGTNNTVINATVGAASIQEIWAVRQGSNGWFLYYFAPAQGLFRVDISNSASFPVAAASHIQVPFGVPAGGAKAYVVRDICQFENGIAILTQPSDGDVNTTDDVRAWEVWFFDGSNTTLLAQGRSLSGNGMCNVGGVIYLSGRALDFGTNGPVLHAITSSSLQTIRLNIGYGNDPNARIGQPVGAGNKVYIPLSLAPVNQVDSTGNYIVVYDTDSGALSHLPAIAGADPNEGVTLLRSVGLYGECLFFAYLVGGSVALAHQAGFEGEGITYSSPGWLVTSLYDFNTPGIDKLIRRIIVQHKPLNAGEHVYVEAHVDQSPLDFTTSLGPTPASASVNNSTVGSTSTVLTLPVATIGKAMYVGLKLTAGTNNATTPQVNWITIEVTTPWAWKMSLDCSSQRKNLSGNDDTQAQGVRGKDLYWLLHNAWENALPVTFYHPNGTSYVASIEDLGFDFASPQLARVAGRTQDVQDFDTYVSLTLRQTLS